jgi:hypothetical protein
MKDLLHEIVTGVQDNNTARCLTREYLQARLLQCLQDGGAFESWAFVGGTALRFLYDMPRFSEDLDFSLVRAGAPDRFGDLLQKAKSCFLAEGYTATIKAKEDKAVKSAFVKFEGLLYDLALSPHRSETISIKIEIDVNPPTGAVFESSVIRRHVLLHLKHYDRSSLLGGKLHALLTRPYVKGRDVYDLLWYLSDRRWPPPNIAFLNQALSQSNYTGTAITSTNWKEQIATRIAAYNWNQVIADARPFLERSEDEAILSRETLFALLEQST